nr:hypothetical protein [Paraflavitalea devenefica]
MNGYLAWVEQGADTTVVNSREQKAIDYATIKGFNEITILLLSLKTL